MLIEDKFIYVSLPRRGSTSFHYSCILSDFTIKNIDSFYETQNSKIDFNSIDESNIMDYIFHGHERLNEIQQKFGNNYPIIAVNRNRYEVFYSLLKHIIFDIKRAGFYDIANHFSKLTTDELFFFNTTDIISKKSRWESIVNHLYINGLIKDNKPYSPIRSLSINNIEYIINIIDILLTPVSDFHNHNKNIIWFDINNLSDMENWVSDITMKPFKIQSVNSSKHIDCNIVLDDYFIKKYDSVFDYYDFPKSKNTLI